MNPGSTLVRRAKLFTISPAPINKTSDNATSSVMRMARPRPDPALPPRSPCFNPSEGATPDVLMAGAKPNRTPVRTDAARAKARTSPFRPMFLNELRPGGLIESRTGIAHAARSTPSAPPSRARSRLSVSNCRIKRARLAPSAKRMEISRARVAERARRRLATLAQPMTSSEPTAARRTQSTGRISPTASS